MMSNENFFHHSNALRLISDTESFKTNHQVTLNSKFSLKWLQIIQHRYVFFSGTRVNI